MSVANAASKIPPVNRLYRFKRPDILDENIFSKLPEAYKKFYKEWQLSVPAPVHYIPKPGNWERNPETGEVKPIQNVPILPKYPHESHKGLWGGEGVLKGYQRRKRYDQKSARFWFPILKRSVVYSEILDKRMSTIVTQRTLDLILDNHGLDHYLLKSRACDIQSELGCKLKQKMLSALFYKDLYQDDPEKKELIYDKYKQYLDGYAEEDIEWYGLNMNEAIKKMQFEEENLAPQPLKHQFRKELIEQLKEKLLLDISAKEEEERASSTQSTSSWIGKINPFSKK